METTAPSPGHPTPLLLQDSPDPDAPLWERAIPAWAWHRVLGDTAAHLHGTEPDDQLWAAHDGRAHRLGPLGPHGRDLPLGPDGAEWYWVEGTGATRLEVDREATLPPVTVVMPTFRREQDATAQAARFAAMALVARVLVIDQGGTLAEHAGFSALRAARPMVELITQPNLGGSGGYARGMAATLDTPEHAVFLGDDDAMISEEALRRMLTAQALAPRPTIVGTGMLAAQEPSVLISHAETVDRRRFHWRPADGMHGPLDLSGTTPADWDALLPRHATTYSGWWGTLLPPGTVAALGLPAPYFLKWDDAEYGLRATAAGHEHLVLPGASVTHPTWDAYRTQMTWTARVMHRNRLTTAASDGAARGVVVHSLLHQLKHVLAGHHLTARLWEDGIDQFRAGPAGWLGHDLPRARSAGQEIVEAWQGEQAPLTVGLSPTRHRPLPLVRGACRAATRALGLTSRAPVVLALSAADVSWRSTLGADTVVVNNADGGRVDAWAVRGTEDRRLLRRVLRSHAGLLRSWGGLRRRYARALPASTTPAAWATLLPPNTTDGDR